MNNRLGSTIERSRHLVEARNQTEEEQAVRHPGAATKNSLAMRTPFQVAITLAAASVLLAALLIIALFIGVVVQLEIAAFVMALFVTCLGCMIASLIYVLRDINMSLHALDMELAEPEEKGS